MEEEERLLVGGFVVLGSNAFGRSFRYMSPSVFLVTNHGFDFGIIWSRCLWDKYIFIIHKYIFPFFLTGSCFHGDAGTMRKKSNSGRVLPCQSHLPNICYMDLSCTTFFLTVMISLYAKSSIRSWIRFERSKLFRCRQRQTSKDTGFHCFSFDVVVTQLLRLRRAIIRSCIF